MCFIFWLTCLEGKSRSVKQLVKDCHLLLGVRLVHIQDDDVAVVMRVAIRAIRQH